MLIALLYACEDEPKEEEVCAAMPDSASAPPAVLRNEDDCGYWTLAAYDDTDRAQLVVSIVVDEAEAPCTSEAGAGLELLYDPLYANMDEPKWTFQIAGREVADAIPLSITCDEGTTWHAKVDVVE